tara:strand:+ start:595 stop:1080 length:486 start_codon:yes stop_codon:yes gene_type:complete
MKIFILYLSISLNIFFYFNNAFSKVVTNKIYIGSIISLTGEHSSQSLILKKKYDDVVKKINKEGGVNVGGKLYQFEIIYYDDESNSSRTNHLIIRLIQNDGVQFIIAPHKFKLFDSVKDIIKKNQISVAKPTKAIINYKNAFETVNTFSGKEISNILFENK